MKLLISIDVLYNRILPIGNFFLFFFIAKSFGNVKPYSSVYVLFFLMIFYRCNSIFRVGGKRSIVDVVLHKEENFVPFCAKFGEFSCFCFLSVLK